MPFGKQNFYIYEYSFDKNGRCNKMRFMRKIIIIECFYIYTGARAACYTTKRLVTTSRLLYTCTLFFLFHLVILASLKSKEARRCESPFSHRKSFC